MTANAITLIRMLFTFAVVALLGVHRNVNIACLATLVGIFALDALDGYVARKFGNVSAIGARLDIVADRIIENTFWIYFACEKLIPMWMPIIIMTRGFLTDGLKRESHSPRSPWAAALTQSRVSRAIYGAAKMFTFLYLAAVKAAFPLKVETGLFLAPLTVAMCLLRGIPGLIENLLSSKSR